MSYLAFPKKKVKRNPKRVHAVDAFFNTACDGVSDIEKPKQIILQMNKEVMSKVSDKIKDLPKPYIIFSPGGENDLSRQGRIWADEYWIELGKQLSDKYGGTIFICGSPSERKRHEIFKQIPNAKIFSGNLALEESAALYALSDLFISGDSGPLHIASCFDINIIALLGSMNPVNVAPYGHENSCIVPTTDCKFCGEKRCNKLKENEKITPCMLSITPNMVIEHIEKYVKFKS